MKKSIFKTITFLLIFSFLLLPVNTALAGHKYNNRYNYGHHHGHKHYKHGSSGWDDFGKVMAGVVGFSILYTALNQPSHYSSTSYSVGYSSYGPSYVGYSTTTYTPAPVIYTPQPTSVWVEGYYVEVPERIWVNGYYQKRWVPDFYDWVWTDCGKRYVKIRNGYYETTWVPGCYTTRYVRKWVPGHWQ